MTTSSSSSCFGRGSCRCRRHRPRRCRACASGGCGDGLSAAQCSLLRDEFGQSAGHVPPLCASSSTNAANVCFVDFLERISELLGSSAVFLILFLILFLVVIILVLTFFSLLFVCVDIHNAPYLHRVLDNRRLIAHLIGLRARFDERGASCTQRLA